MTKFTAEQIEYLEKKIVFLDSENVKRGFSVEGSVEGNVEGSVRGYVGGNIWGSVKGYVWGDVWGNVEGSIGKTGETTCTQTPDITPEAVERLSPYAVDGGCDAYGQMGPDTSGDYVSLTDYDTLAARLAECEARLLEVEAALAATVQREADTTARYDAKLSQCEARLLGEKDD